jgi:hypothetical protein
MDTEVEKRESANKGAWLKLTTKLGNRTRTSFATQSLYEPTLQLLGHSSASGQQRPFPASNEDAANRNNKSNQAEYSKLTNRPAWRSAGQKLTAATAGPLATVCIAAETRGRPASSPIQTRRHPQRKTCSRHTPWKPHWATQFLSMELR